jgi:hypothetical protein
MSVARLFRATFATGKALNGQQDTAVAKIRTSATEGRSEQSSGWRQQSIPEAQKRLLHTEPENSRDGKACYKVGDKANST